MLQLAAFSLEDVMAIRVEHQAAPGIQGLAAFAGGRGKARQRQRTELLSFYRDEAQRRERREAQTRAFTYQGALENMRQGGMDRRREEDREFGILDDARDRQQELEDDARDRKRAMADLDARETRDIARDDRRWRGYQDRDRAQRESDFDMTLREGVQSGEFGFDDDNDAWTGAGGVSGIGYTRTALKTLADAKARLAANDDWDDEQKAEVLGRIEARERQLLRTAKPIQQPTLDDDFSQTVRTDPDGTQYTKKADGTWTVLKEGPAGEARERLVKEVQRLQAEHEGEEPLSYATAIPSAQRNIKAIDAAIAQDQQAPQGQPGRQRERELFPGQWKQQDEFDAQQAAEQGRSTPALIPRNTPTFRTDAEVDAAMNSGEIQPGQSFVGPDGKRYTRK